MSCPCEEKMKLRFSDLRAMISALEPFSVSWWFMCVFMKPQWGHLQEHMTQFVIPLPCTQAQQTLQNEWMNSTPERSSDGRILYLSYLSPVLIEQSRALHVIFFVLLETQKWHRHKQSRRKHLWGNMGFCQQVLSPPKTLVYCHSTWFMCQDGEDRGSV